MKDLYQPGDIYKESIDEIYEKYNDAIDWLKKLGLPIKNARLGSYKLIFNEYYEKVKTPTDICSNRESLDTFLRTHLEVSEIIRVYDTHSKKTI